MRIAYASAHSHTYLYAVISAAIIMPLHATKFAEIEKLVNYDINIILAGYVF